MLVKTVHRYPLTTIVCIAATLAFGVFFLASRQGTYNVNLSNYDPYTAITRAHELFEQGNHNRAHTLYKHALRKDPKQVNSLMQQAQKLMMQEQLNHAVACFQSIIEVYPQYPSSHVCLGMCLAKRKDHKKAVTHYQKALQIRGDYTDAYRKLSESFLAMDNTNRALHYIQQALRVEPNNPSLHVHLGDIYSRSGKPQRAHKAYMQALKHDSDCKQAHYGLGYAYLQEGELHKAIEKFNKAITYQSDHYDAHMGLAFAHWALGDLPKAFAEYEWRWKPGKPSPKTMPVPLWDGSDLKGKTILVYSEQGMGDTLQFIRFAKQLKEMGARVVCGVQAPLMKILGLCPYIDEIRGEYRFDGLDVQAPVMSLARILKTTKETIPTEIPYLYADEKLIEQWKQKLADDKNFKVGLAWHVDPKHEGIKSPLSKRSIPIKQFTPLANIPGVSFYSLQKSGGEQQLTRLSKKFNIKTFGADFDESHGRFMDTAAIITQLDLIISVDTSIVHLAAGLGKPVWNILPYAPDGRWELNTNSTPWYPAMKLFRQQKHLDWTQPIAQVKQELAALVSKQ